MKFKDLAYGKDEEVFLFYSESDIQHMAKRVINDHLSQVELLYLKAKTITAMQNLIAKIGSSGIDKEKIRRGDEETQYQEDLERSSRGSY